MIRSDLRRVGLRVFFALLVLNALVAIVIVLGGDVGDTGGSILGTSMILTAVVMFSLLCATGARGRRMEPVWALGVGATVAAGAMWIYAIWHGDDGGDTFTDISLTLIVVVVGVAMTSLLSHAVLAPHARWTVLAANAAIALLGVMLIVAIWGGSWGSDGYWQLFTVVSIVLAALAIAIPVLHVNARRTLQPDDVGQTRVAYCPMCGAPDPSRSGEVLRCANCLASFRVTVRPPA